MPPVDRAERFDSGRRLSLGGEWHLTLDPDGRGLAEDWPGAGWPAPLAQPVPAATLWDVTHPDYEGVGFYRRAFELPAEWLGKALRLHCEGVAYRAEAWLNGHYVGSHEGAYTPFSFDLTAVAGAMNVLVVRVAGLSRQRAVDGQRLEQAPAAKQNWHYAHGGVWGRVHVEAREWVAVQALRIAPDLQRELAEVEVIVNNRRAESRLVEVRLTIVQPDGAVAAEVGGPVAVPPGEARLAYRVPLPRPWPWHYDTPHLYHLEAAVADGPDSVDRQSATFGMRDFSVQQGQFYLNGAPVYVRGVLAQPTYPVGLIAPTDPEMLRREIMLAKAAGFNLIRVHLRPPPPGFLELADELGMLVYVESTLAWIRDSPRMFDHCRREVQAMIERDFNHPSVVIWGLFNENPPASQLLSEPLLRHARALDPTRVVIDNSGGALAIDQNFGWIDRAHAVANRDTVHQKLLDIHLYLGAYLPQPIYEWLRTVGSDVPSDVMVQQDFGSAEVLAEFDREMRREPGRLFVSELGSGGLMNLDAALARYGDQTALRDAREFRAFRHSLHAGFQARGLNAIFDSLVHLVQAAQAGQAVALVSQMEAALTNPRVSGFVLTQLNDVAWEFHAGLLDVWREPKPAYEAVQRLNQPQVLVMRAEAETVAAGEAVGLRLTLVSREALPPNAQVLVSVRAPSGQAQQLTQFQAPSSVGLYPLPAVTVRALEAGSYRVSARLEAAGGLLAETAQPLLCLPPVVWEALPVAVDWRGHQPTVAAQFPGADAAGGQGAVLVAAQPASLTDDDWDALLDAVAAGQSAVIGPLHVRDALALRRLARRGLDLRLHLGIGSWMGCYHWQPASPLFAGLPAGGLASQAYVDVLPWYVLAENGGEVLAGALRHTQSNLEASTFLWYSDVERVPLGAGRLSLCQYRVFDEAHRNPLAGRLLANLLGLAQGV